MRQGEQEARIAVRGSGLRKSGGALVACDGVSFDVRCGGVFACLGPNGAERRSRAAELIGRFGLAEKADQPFAASWRGMKRRLTIAAALVHRPEMLFLDGPTTR